MSETDESESNEHRCCCSINLERQRTDNARLETKFAELKADVFQADIELATKQRDYALWMIVILLTFGAVIIALLGFIGVDALQAIGAEQGAN